MKVHAPATEKRNDQDEDQEDEYHEDRDDEEQKAHEFEKNRARIKKILETQFEKISNSNDFILKRTLTRAINQIDKMNKTHYDFHVDYKKNLTFKENLNNIFSKMTHKKDNKPLRENTVITYTYNAYQVYLHLGSPDHDNFDFLKDTAHVINTILHHETNIKTIRNRFNALHMLCRVLKFPYKIISEYFQQKKKYEFRIKRQYNSSQPNKNDEIAKDVKWEDIEEIPIQIKQQRDNLPINGFEYYRVYQEYIVALVYINPNGPLRLEYRTCRVFENEVPKEFEKDTTINYVLLENGNSAKVVLQDFKNIRYMGKQIISFDESTAIEVIRFHNWKKEHHKPISYLFNTAQSKNNAMSSPFSQKAFTQLTTRIMSRVLDVKMTVNTLRRKFETQVIQSNYHLRSNDRNIEMHKNLLHSQKTALENYKVVNNDNHLQLKEHAPRKKRLEEEGKEENQYIIEI